MNDMLEKNDMLETRKNEDIVNYSEMLLFEVIRVRFCQDDLCSLCFLSARNPACLDHRESRLLLLIHK